MQGDQRNRRAGVQDAQRGDVQHAQLRKARHHQRRRGVCWQRVQQDLPAPNRLHQPRLCQGGLPFVPELRQLAGLARPLLAKRVVVQFGKRGMLLQHHLRTLLQAVWGQAVHTPATEAVRQRAVESRREAYLAEVALWGQRALAHFAKQGDHFRRRLHNGRDSCQGAQKGVPVVGLARARHQSRRACRQNHRGSVAQHGFGSLYPLAIRCAHKEPHGVET